MSRLIVAKLNGVRRKHAAVAAARAAVGVVAVAVVCLAGGMLADRYLDLSERWRAGLLVADGTAAVVVLVVLGLRPIARGPTVEQAALWVERAEPAFRSRLISAVQFGRAKDLNGASPAMVAAMVEQAERVARGVRFGRVVRTDRLRRTAIVAVVVVVAAAGGAAYGGPVTRPLLWRALLVPGVELPRRTRVTCLSNDVAVARGESVTLSARAAGEVPAAGVVRVAYTAGGVAEFPLVADDKQRDVFSVKIDNVQDGFGYTVVVGDDQSGPHRVKVAVRPAVVAVACQATFPAYTHLPPTDRSPYDLHVLAGGRLAVKVKANKPLRASPDVAGNHLHLLGSEVDFPLAGDVNDPSNLHVVDGKAADVPVPAGTTGFRVELVDADGLRSVDPVTYRVTVDADGPPTVRLTAPANDGLTVTPAAKPEVAVEADDDFGVATLTLRYRVTHSGQAEAAQDDPHGLTATYYQSPDLTGTGVVRTDDRVDLDWAVDHPPAGIAGTFAVRWTGEIVAPREGDYVFRGDFSGGVRVWVDGQPVIDRWAYANNSVPSSPVHLIGGRKVPVRVEAQGTTLAATGMARLLWRTNATPWQTVPHEAFLRPAVAVPTTGPTGGPTADSVAIAVGPVPEKAVSRRLAWDLSALPRPPVAGDTVELWVEAADANDVTGPGTAASDHRLIRVVSVEEKRKELMDRLGDYMGKVHAVSDDERTLNAKVGTMLPK